MIKRFLVLLLGVVWGMASIQAASIDATLQCAVDNLQPGQTVQAIVYMSHQADIAALNIELKAEHATLAERNRRVVLALQDAATESQPEMTAFLDELKSEGSIIDYRAYWITNMYIVNCGQDGIQKISQRDDVAELYYDYEIENINPVTQKQNDRLIAGHEMGLTRINAPQVWAQGWTGQGRVVMNIDTGVEGTHPALSARFRGDVDGDSDVDESWFDPYTTNYPTPEDDGGHGTHTMGTICGRTASGDTIGVAINAQWIAAAAIDRGGGIPQTVADAIASFQWAVDPDGNPNTQDNPDAIGNSWGVTTSHGYPPCDQTFWVVIDNVEAAGSVVVFSAGNEGSSANTLRRPSDRGTTPYNCFSVGAVDGANSNLPIADFSSRGPSNCGPGGQTVIKPEVVAPGVSVRSSYPGGGYTSMSGTSMASPHVTGSVAIIRQVNPNLDADAVKEILFSSCTDLGSIGEDNDYGNGVINLQMAVQLAMTGFGSADGYIRDASNNNPLPGQINVVNGFNSTDANSSGYYIMSLPADTSYTLRASYFGYLPTDHSVPIVANDTTTQNFLLSPAPTAILQGYVVSVDGDTLAGAAVAVLNTPITPVLTNSHGFYQFTNIPVGSTYTVQAIANNYAAGISDIYINSGTNILNFQLQPAETFENNDGLYIGTYPWEWGVPTSGPFGAHSGEKLWATVLGGEYDDNTIAPLVSREYTIISPSAMLQFYHWYSFENSYDGGNVSISTDNGSTWELITPTIGYPDDDISSLGEPGYTASSDWSLAEFDISTYVGQTVKFRWMFGSDVSITDFGWYIDDVSVIGAGVPLPPNVGYNPASFTVQAAVGAIETRSLQINNTTGQGFLYYTLNPETFNGLRNDNGATPVSLSIARQEPIAIVPADKSKAGAIDEPVYPPVIVSQGGPDTFGHRWIDSDEVGGPAVAWVDISGVGTPVTLTDDSSVGPIAMGLNFPYFEGDYNQIYICSNGLLTFGTGSNSYSNTTIPNTSTPNDFLPIWWDDLNPTDGGAILYYYDSANSRFIVSYNGVPNYTPSHSGGGSLSFQALLYSSGRIEFNYGTMDPGSDALNVSTIGIENVDGTDGLQVVYDADYMHNNLSILFTRGWLFASPTGGTLAPGANTTATITFDATLLAAGTYTGNLNLDTNDPDSPNIDIPVTFNVGSGGTPNIVQTPSNLNDTLSAGSSSILYLKVKNTGTATLTATFSDSATWITVNPGPVNVNPGDSVFQAVTLNAAGLTPGTYNSRVVTASNDIDTPNILVPVTLLVTASGTPEISLTPTVFEDTVQTGNSKTKYLYIANIGTADLYYGGHDNRAWITVVPDTGFVPASSTDTLQIQLSASALTPGTYSGQLNINSNDSDEGVTVISVTLLVTEVGSGCAYVPGDINGNGAFNGIDVTYGVSYFKGGAVPPYVCNCNGSDWYVAGDVNNSCVFNGIDITYAVGYFKGGPAPIPCAACPPTAQIAIEKPGVTSNSITK